jgi:hypothetical protein
MEHFNINTAGYIIVGMFIVFWTVALLFWRYGHVEEKWGSKLKVAVEESDTLGAAEYWVSDVAPPLGVHFD